MNRIAVAGLAAATAAVLAVPGVASAHKYTAYAGNPGKTPKSAPKSTELNQFFPQVLRVRKGDRVTYLNYAFHTVSVLGKNAPAPALALPDPSGAKYSGIQAPDGSSFFFNGQTKFVYNPAVFGPVGKPNVKDTGTHSSGAFGASAKGPGKYTLKFSRPGTYTVLCLLHPGMKQVVHVLGARSRKADSNAKVRAAVARQSTRLYKAASQAAKVNPPVATVFAGVEKKNATLLAFAPQSLEVKVGTTVNFINDAPSEVHNMTFIGPKGPDGTPTAQAFTQAFQQSTDLFPPQGNQVSPPFIYGSQPPASPGTWTYGGDEYGDGFLWTPLMDGIKGEPPNGLPSSERITFTKPGTYAYFCAIHGPSMSGTVTVAG